MTDLHDNVNRLIRTLGDPEPPQGLRGRTLARAQAAWARPAADRWLALWESRPLRLAWAATVLLLVACNFALRTGSPAPPRAVAPAVAFREQTGLKELQAVVELPRLRQEDIGIDASGGLAGRGGGSLPTVSRHTQEDKS